MKHEVIKPNFGPAYTSQAREQREAQLASDLMDRGCSADFAANCARREIEQENR